MELVQVTMDIVETNPVAAYAVLGVAILWALAWAVRLSAH